MTNALLSGFANEFPYCALCWTPVSLHIHHIVGGPARKHVRENLLRLCSRCHEALHSGGRGVRVTNGMCLTAKRECDSAHYKPEALAQLRHKVHLGYGPEPISKELIECRLRNGMPQEMQGMPINSRRKGKVGELEARDHWNRLVPNANSKRSQQHSGTESASDLISPGTPGLWLEVKRVQSLNIHAVLEKSREQCGSLTPVVLHRKNGTEWLVTFPLEQIASFVGEVTRAS